MSKPIFKFAITDDLGRYYGYSDGVVTAGSFAPIYLQESVIDWDTLQMQYKRFVSQPYFQGVIREYAPDRVRFAKAGAAILRFISTNQGGREAKANLVVMKLKTTDQQYYPRGTCAIDFSVYENELNFVSVMLIGGGLAAMLNAYDSTDFDIPIGDPLTDPYAAYVYMEGVNLQGTYNYQTQQSADSLISVTAFSQGGGTFDESTVAAVFINEEGAYPVGITSSVLSNIPVPGGTFDNAHVFEALHGFTGNLRVNINFDTIASSPFSDRETKLSLWAHVYKTGWVVVSATKLWEDPAGFIDIGDISPTTTATSDDLFPDGWSRVFAPGEFIVLSWRVDVDTPATTPATNMQITLSATPAEIALAYQYVQAPSVTRALSHWHLFRKLAYKISGTLVDPISNLLTTDDYPGPANYNLNPVNTYFASGDCLRQLTTGPDGTAKDPAIKTSMSDFVKDAFVSAGASLGIERNADGVEVFRLEKLAHFYQKDVLIANLGSAIAKFKMYPYNDYIGNNIKAGYKDQKYDEVNGRFEFNSEVNFQTPITRMHKDVDMQSPYRADCYGEEYTRANLANKKTTDSGSDNDIFKIQCNGNTLEIDDIAPAPQQIDRAHAITSGLPIEVRETVFNIPLSPKRNLLRCLPWLKSNYGDLRLPVLKYTTGAKNTGVISTMYTGPEVVENADIDITPDGTGTDILFKPMVFEFEAQVPINLPELMEANPYGVFRLEYKKQMLEGFALECGVADGTNDVYNFKLLCSPNTTIPATL